MNLKNIESRLRQLLFLPYSLIFCFHYLPFRQAVKIPVIFMCRPCFLKLGGSVEITSPQIRTGMIKLGTEIAPIEAVRTFRWQNEGTILFKGSCIISHHTFISCAEGARIEFGGNSSFSLGLRLIAANQIIFGEKVRISWNCTFMDTDWHPIIDLLSGRTLPVSRPIAIGDAAWIGHDCIVSKGSKLAANSIVASGSIVKGCFKTPNTIIGGNPAEILDEGFCRDDINKTQNIF